MPWHCFGVREVRCSCGTIRSKSQSPDVLVCSRRQGSIKQTAVVTNNVCCFCLGFRVLDRSSWCQGCLEENALSTSAKIFDRKVMVSLRKVGCNGLEQFHKAQVCGITVGTSNLEVDWNLTRDLNLRSREDLSLAKSLPLQMKNIQNLNALRTRWEEVKSLLWKCNERMQKSEEEMNLVFQCLLKKKILDKELLRNCISAIPLWELEDSSTNDPQNCLKTMNDLLQVWLETSSNPQNSVSVLAQLQSNELVGTFPQNSMQSNDSETHVSLRPTSLSEHPVSEPESSWTQKLEILSNESTFELSTIPFTSFQDPIPRDHLRIEEDQVLGKGSFSIVYSGKVQLADKTYVVAVKVLRRDHEDALEREAKFLKRCAGNAHCVRIFTTCKENLSIVLEKVSHGSLQDVFEATVEKPKIEFFRFNNKFFFCKGIASGLCALHSQGLVHRDLKPSNILVDSSLQAKIGDFGSVCQVEEETASKTEGTVRYMAPEIMNGQRATCRSDQFSLALIMWYVYSASPERLVRPWFEFSEDEEIIEAVKSGYRPKWFKDSMHSPFRKLVENCWHQDQDTRPSAGIVVETLDRLINHKATSQPFRRHEDGSLSTVGIMNQNRNLACRLSDAVIAILEHRWKKLNSLLHYVIELEYMKPLTEKHEIAVWSELVKHLKNSGRPDMNNSEMLFSPISNHELKSVIIIHDIDRYQVFLHACKQLGRRADQDHGWKCAKSTFYQDWDKSSWKNQTAEQIQWRKMTNAFFESYATITIPSELCDKKPQLKHVRILTTFHGCKSLDVAFSICQTGFANLKITDNGFFGSGYYFTPDLRYALEHYAQAGDDGSKVVLVCDVVVGNVYPVIESAVETADPNVDTLFNKPLIPRYDAHFAAVHSGPPCEICRPDSSRPDNPVYGELVVAENSQVLPRFILIFKCK